MRDALHDRLLCTALDDYAARETELGAVGPARRSVRPRLRVFIGFVAARLAWPIATPTASRHGPLNTHTDKQPRAPYAVSSSLPTPPCINCAIASVDKGLAK